MVMKGAESLVISESSNSMKGNSSSWDTDLVEINFLALRLGPKKLYANLPRSLTMLSKFAWSAKEGAADGEEGER